MDSLECASIGVTPGPRQLPEVARLDVTDWLLALRARLVRRCKTPPRSGLPAIARKAERIVQAPDTAAERRKRLGQLRAETLADLHRRGRREMEHAAIVWIFKVAARHLTRPSGLHASLLPTLSGRHDQAITFKKQRPRIWDDVARHRESERSDYLVRRDLGLKVQAPRLSPHPKAAPIIQAMQGDLDRRWARTIWRCQNPYCDVAGGRFFSGGRGARKDCDQCARRSSRSSRRRQRQQDEVELAARRALDRLRKHDLSDKQREGIKTACRRALERYRSGLPSAKAINLVNRAFAGLPRPGRRWPAHARSRA